MRRRWIGSDELLEYPGYHGFRSLCHLLLHIADSKTRVCTVGNFDQELGTYTTNVIETVATAIAQRIETDEFRLIEWHPHAQGGARFCEVVQESVPSSAVNHGQTLVGNQDHWQTIGAHTAVVRFANPRWKPLTVAQVATLVGQETVYELYTMAGIKGDYTPKRLFGSTGQRLADEILAHNDAQARALIAQIAEWQGQA